MTFTPAGYTLTETPPSARPYAPHPHHPRPRPTGFHCSQAFTSNVETLESREALAPALQAQQTSRGTAGPDFLSYPQFLLQFPWKQLSEWAKKGEQHSLK